MIKQLSPEIYKEIEESIGKDLIKKLHESNRFLDLLAVIGIPSLFLFNIYVLGTYDFGIVWGLVFILQGFVLQVFGFAGHELFTHRKVIGNKLSYLVSLLYYLPLTMLPSHYSYFHMAHHRYLNTDMDTEAYKQDIDTRLKRVILLTFIGQLLSHRRTFYTGKPEDFIQPVHIEAGSKTEKLVNFENKLLLGFIVMVVVLLLLFPNYVFFGYLLPFFIIFPLASSLRLILEHTDVDVNNPLQIAINYKTGPFSRLLFFYDSGDCHLVHHLFPKIPFYNIHKMTKLLEPLLKKYHVTEHRSLIKLIYAYYVLDLPHRSSWNQQKT